MLEPTQLHISVSIERGGFWMIEYPHFIILFLCGDANFEATHMLLLRVPQLVGAIFFHCLR